MKKALSSLPKTLNDTYARILAQIDENYKDDALSVFRWLAFSTRMMCLEEIAEAAVLRPTMTLLSSDTRLTDIEDVIGICSSMLTVERFGPTQRIVRFAHFSVQEYLLSCEAGYFSISEISSHDYIAGCCISYLLQFNEPLSETEASRSSWDDFPLIVYATNEWYTHVEMAERGNSNSYFGALIKFFSSGFKNAFARWKLTFKKPHRLLGKFTRENKDPPLFYTSYLGLVEATEWLLQSGVDINERYTDFERASTALEAAILGGRINIVRLLLDRGAECKFSLPTAFMYVRTEERDTEMVLTLLKKGASLEFAESSMSEPPLVKASSFNSEELVRILLEYGGNPNPGLKNPGCAAPLHIASYLGRQEIFDLLVDAGADVHVHGGYYGSCIQAAAFGESNGHHAIIRRLIKLGVDINTHEPSRIGYMAPLQHASSRSHLSTMELLIDLGAAVEGVHNEPTPLQCALESGGSEAVRVLLKRGANVNASREDLTVLQWAAGISSYKSSKGFNLLLEAGAEVDASADAKTDTALWYASRGGSTRIVKLLLKYGANANLPATVYNCTALQIASEKGHIGVARCLIKAGADVNATGSKEAETALWLASRAGHSRTVELLCQNGANKSQMYEEETQDMLGNAVVLEEPEPQDERTISQTVPDVDEGTSDASYTVRT